MGQRLDCPILGFRTAGNWSLCLPRVGLPLAFNCDDDADDDDEDDDEEDTKDDNDDDSQVFGCFGSGLL